MINKKRLLETFFELSQIDSPSGEEEAVAQILVAKLETLGAKVERDSYGNVLGKIEGVGEPFMLNAHMDTVEPGRGIKSHVKGDRIVSDGTTIAGGDCKSGISIILEAIQALKESKALHPQLEIVFTRGEEIGLLGAVHLDYSKIESKMGLTFDGPARVTNVTIAAPGYNEINIDVTGRAAHAGGEPEKGLSAIKIAAEIIAKLKVGRIDAETTANIGIITGGTARNAVPETTSIKGEIRSRNLQKLLKHTAHFESVVLGAREKYPDSKIEFEVRRQFDAYRFKENHPVVEKVLKIFKDMKLKPNLRESGGGTDVSIFQTHGIEALCVGIAGYEAHTVREYVDIPELVEATEFLVRFLQD